MKILKLIFSVMVARRRLVCAVAVALALGGGVLYVRHTGWEAHKDKVMTIVLKIREKHNEARDHRLDHDGLIDLLQDGKL